MGNKNYTTTSAVSHLLRLSRRLNLSSHATMMSCPRRGPSPLDRFAVRHFRVGPSRKAVAASHFHFCHRKPRYAARRRPFAPPPLAHFPTSRPGRVASRRAQRGISHSSSAHDFSMCFSSLYSVPESPTIASKNRSSTSGGHPLQCLRILCIAHKRSHTLHTKFGPRLPCFPPLLHSFPFFVFPTHSHTHTHRSHRFESKNTQPPIQDFQGFGVNAIFVGRI